MVALILHFRHADLTASCLDALVAEGMLRAVVVDNSEDAGASLHELRPRLAELSAMGAEIVLVEPGRNLGFSAGVNLAIRSARQHFGPTDVLVMNNDARLMRGSLQSLRDRLACGAAGSVVAPVIRSPDGTEIRGAWYQRLLGLYFLRPAPGCVRYLSGCCLAVPMQLCSEPLFNEDFFFYGEDVELSARLARMGVQLEIDDSALVEHAATSSSRNGSLFYEYHMNRAHLLLASRLNQRAIARVVATCGRLLTLPVRAAIRTVRFRAFTPWRGLALALFDVARGRLRTLTPSPARDASA